MKTEKEFFKSLLPQMRAEVHFASRLQSDCDRLQLLIRVNREGLERLNTQGGSQDVAAQRRDYQNRIIHLNELLYVKICDASMHIRGAIYLADMAFSAEQAIEAVK